MRGAERQRNKDIAPIRGGERYIKKRITHQ
jgi:hypothetical protein